MQGFTLFVSVLTITVALLMGLNLLSVWFSRRKIGQPAPAMPGAPSVEKALYYFYSPSCGPCRAMTPVVKAMASEDPRVRAVDVSHDPEVAMRFGVMATPTVVLVAEGRIADVVVGPQGADRLRALIA